MKTLLLALTSIFLAVFAFRVSPNLTVKAKEPMATKQSILDATVQLRIFSEDGSYYEQGLGTLTGVSGETLIVTHNHWHFLQQTSKVQFLDAHNTLLMEMGRPEFKGLILYTNPGTLILKAPAILKGIPAVMGNIRAIQVGDQVTVAHQNSVDPSQVDLLPAKIQAVDTFGGLPVYRYMSLDGESIIPGDSGGGVWSQGKLVANNWAMYLQSTGPAAQPIQETIAAQLPLDQIGLVSAAPTNSQPDENGRHTDHAENN